MVEGRLTEEVVVRGVIDTLQAHRFDLPPEAQRTVPSARRHVRPDAPLFGAS
jgi:hypothetical protein